MVVRLSGVTLEVLANYWLCKAYCRFLMVWILPYIQKVSNVPEAWDAGSQFMIVQPPRPKDITRFLTCQYIGSLSRYCQVTLSTQRVHSSAMPPYPVYYFNIFCGIRPLTTKKTGHLWRGTVSTHTTLCLYPGTLILGRLTSLRSGFLDKLTGKLAVSWNHLIPWSVKKMLAQPTDQRLSSTEHSKWRIDLAV